MRPPPIDRSRGRDRLRPVLLAVPALVAMACGSAVVEHAAGDVPLVTTAVERSELGEEKALPVAAAPASSLVPVDVLDAVVEVARAPIGPSVPTGTCDTVVYTPPTAAVARSGELCVPEAPTGDVVILVHGGGGHSGSPGSTRPWRDEHLAAGRTTFAVEYALVTEATGDGLWPLAEQNIKAAVQYVRVDGSLLTGELVVHGFSAGARLAAIVATTAGDPAFAGDELWDGVRDGVDRVVLFYGYYDGFQFFTEPYYGGPVPAPADTLGAVDADDPPMLVVHGRDDVVVAVDHSLALAAAVDAAGGEVRLVAVDDADHAFDVAFAGEAILGLTPAGEALVAHVDAFLRGPVV